MENVPSKTDLVQIKGKAKNGKVKLLKLDRSFMSRVIQGDKIKRFYEEVKNYCLSFEKVKARTAWGAESFSVGNETVVRLIVVGGALCVCLALNPDDYAQKDYPHGDRSSKKEFAATPMLLPVRSAQEAKLARRLIAEAFTSRCVYTQEFPIWTDYAASLLNQKDEALIKKNLIKVSESEVSEAEAQKAIASAAKQEEEEAQEIEKIGGEKKPRAPKKPSKPKKVEEEPATEAPVAEPALVEETAPAEEVTLEVEEKTEAAEGPEEKETEEETDTVFELASDGLVIEVKYDRSFLSRIIQNQKAKEYYSEVKNYALSFGLKSRPSWKADSFYLGRNTYVVAKVRGKTLNLFLALDPKAYEESVYHQVDVSDKKTYEKTPMMLRVKSDLGLKKAKKLIEEMLTAAGLAEKETESVDYVSMYPYEETDALIEKKLIKRFERHLDAQESAAVIERGEVRSEPEIEEVVFELVEEPEIEDVVFELAEEPVPVVEAPAEEPVEESAPEPKEEKASDDDEEEDVTFEIVEEPATEAQAEDVDAGAAEEKLVTLKKYVRGFAAKMKQGDQERKDYYAEIKAKLLSYKGVRLLESFSGDGYKKGMQPLLKSRIRGKTLCLFFALDTDSYKQTIYRQQYKGDTKAYAATPMMVRVKSEQGLRRALRLVEELEKNYDLKPGTPADLVAVRGEFLFEETEPLVEKGLIKTRTVKVTEAEAERLLKKAK